MIRISLIGILLFAFACNTGTVKHRTVDASMDVFQKIHINASAAVDIESIAGLPTKISKIEKSGREIWQYCKSMDDCTESRMVLYIDASKRVSGAVWNYFESDQNKQITQVKSEFPGLVFVRKRYLRQFLDYHETFDAIVDEKNSIALIIEDGTDDVSAVVRGDAMPGSSNSKGVFPIISEKK